MKKKNPELEDRFKGAATVDILEQAELKDWQLKRLSVSGLYTNSRLSGSRCDELRLDVDGRYPQMTASGCIRQSLNSQVHWIAALKAIDANTWEGRIWYVYPALHFTPFPKFSYPKVRIDVERSLFINQRKAQATFYSEGDSYKLERTYYFRSPYFRTMDFEYDHADGSQPVLSIDTHIHPTHPAGIPAETISFGEVYRRAGFDISLSPQGSVPLTEAGQNNNPAWNDNELHDAMQTYWSHFANAPQWAIWVFFAAAHEQGSGLAGIMFDDIGPNHRQGTSVFLDSPLFHAPAGTVLQQEWEERYKFWCAVHESGHCFNLAHSFQKELGTSWIPLANNPASTSFMNYPFYYPNGQGNSNNSESGYFSDFEYRFDDEELLFMRHAPIKFVQPGNADWFDHHGFQGVNQVPDPPLKLEVRVNRAKANFEFLEPVMLELKLTNISANPVVVDKNILSRYDNMVIIIKKDGKPARQFAPFAHYDFNTTGMIIEPGKSAYESLFPAVGINGWDISEPGYYTVQVCMNFSNVAVVSNPCRIRIAPPLKHEEEWLAQDFFSEEVGRILTFDGSQVLDSGMDTLREVVSRLSENKVAYHANIALAKSVSGPYKKLEIGKTDLSFSNVVKTGGKIVISKPDQKSAAKEFFNALTVKPDEAAESLGHIDYKRYSDQLADWLAGNDNPVEAATVQGTLLKTLRDRGVTKAVLDEVAVKRDGYKQKK